jgi:hypothetical protein
MHLTGEGGEGSKSGEEGVMDLTASVPFLRYYDLHLTISRITERKVCCQEQWGKICNLVRWSYTFGPGYNWRNLV